MTCINRVRGVAALCACAATPAIAQLQLPPDIAHALARADVPLGAVSMVVAPLPPPPGTVSRLPEPVNPSGENSA